MKARYSIVFLAITAAPGAIVRAAEAPALTERIILCSREADRNVRLDCFDRIAAELPPAHESSVRYQGAQNESTRPSGVHHGDRIEAPAAAAPDADFGVSGSAVARTREANEGTADVPKRMTARITAIEQRPRGELVFTLDNGQVWAQKDAHWLPAKVGDSVLIVAGALGSHQLIASGRSSAVTRIR